MSVFGAYARYYDLLYKDKDYLGEADHVASLIRAAHPSASSVLELGCGTGAHAALLAGRHGLRVHGVDRSTEMLVRAESRRSRLEPATAAKLAFSYGDVRDVRLDEQFDAVVSLFHVVSYQATNDDLQRMFATARLHVASGGILVFDVWYGPAVLTTRPESRVRHLEDEQTTVVRHVTPELHANENLVDVHYRVEITDKESRQVEELRETHRMRYLFRPELELLLGQAGFTDVSAAEWMTGHAPSVETWGVCFTARG